MKSGRIQVLFIEDDQVDAELVQRAIADTEVQIELHWVTHLAEATEVLASQRVDLVLSDLSLPDSTSSGGETLRRLREATTDIPIVVLTSIDDPELAVELLEAGAQDYIPKERVTGDILGRAIRHAIQRHQQLVETQRLLDEVQDGRDLLTAKNTKLEKLFKQAQEFVDNVSHEFRTPLTVIMEYVSLVCDGLAGDVNEDQVQMLKIVEDRANDLNTMVDDMLDSSRLESGLLGAWRKPCQVEDILSHVRATLDRKASVKGVQLDYQITPGLPELYCDAEKVGRVITNLAVNAIKFCGDPGVVEISAAPGADGSEVIFSVTDNGPGIDEDGLKQIFSRFQQLGGTSRGSCKGFGLGLAIAKELVDLNLGELTVESVVGRGSSFRFSIPQNEPFELVQRYLRQIELQPDCPPIVSLVLASIDPDPTSAVNDGIDGFLNYLLRRNDLLLPRTGGQWLLALPTDKQEVQEYFARSQQAWEDANRNRPFGPLPKVTYQWLGSWRTPENNHRILESITKHVAREELVCV